MRQLVAKFRKNRAREKFRGYTRRTKTFAVLPSPPLPAFSFSTLDGVPLGMTREMDISTLIGRETKSVFLFGKGYLVNDAWKTGLVLAVLHTVYLETVTSLDITSKLFYVQFAQMCKVFQGVFYLPSLCSCGRDPKSRNSQHEKNSAT